MVYHESSTLFQRMYQVLFFNSTHQVKAIAIGIAKADPLGEICDCSFPLTLHVSLPNLALSKF